MCKDVALTGKIDSEHRARQDLGHGAFGDDLFFLRHAWRIYFSSAPRSRPPDYVTHGLSASRLTELFERKCWQVFAKLLTFPPRAGVAKLIHSCKSITIKHRANVPWRAVGERIVCEQAIHFMRALEQTVNQCDEPRIFARRSQSGKPHLPVESRLVRCTPTGRAFYVARFPFEFVKQPINGIRAAFEDDFAAVLRHLPKQAIAVDNAERSELFVKIRHRPWRST